MAKEIVGSLPTVGQLIKSKANVLRIWHKRHNLLKLYTSGAKGTAIDLLSGRRSGKPIMRIDGQLGFWWYGVGNLKHAMVGLFTPWKLVDVTKRAGCQTCTSTPLAISFPSCFLVYSESTRRNYPTFSPSELSLLCCFCGTLSSPRGVLLFSPLFKSLICE